MRLAPLAPLASIALAIALANAGVSGCASDASGASSADGGAPDGESAAGYPDGGPGDVSVVGAADSATELSFSSTVIDFAAVPCGTAAATRSLLVANRGASPVTVSATITGASFVVSPALLTIDAGSSGTLSVTASVPTSAVAGESVAGALSLTSNAPGQALVTVPLSVTPSGAVLAFAPGEETTFAFPVTEVGYSGDLALVLTNTGNAAATFVVGSPSDARFSLPGDAGVSLAPGDTWRVAVDFTATDTTAVYASSPVTVSGVACASSLEALTYSGRGTTGEIGGWPSTVDFGPADCGGAAPAERSFAVMNGGAADAHLTQVTLTGAPGFTTSAQVGRAIFAGGSLAIRVDAPPVPMPSSSAPVTATLTIQTDAEPSPHAITLTEQPNGAVLAFDTSGTPGFGSFGQVPLLGSASQGFRVVNAGTGAAHVTLVAGPPAAFAVSTPAFALDVGGSQLETASFAPTTGGGITGNIAMSATGVLCAPLPAPVPLSGASGPVPGVSPTALSFGATCGGDAPAPQVITVTNGGNGDMTWSISAPTGSGAAIYALSASPPPGTLAPGASAFVSVTAAAMASPAPSTDPSAFSAQVTITTDVPFDPPHVVTLGETPWGDQLAFAAAGPLRFGQVPLDASLSQGFAVVNGANAGSAPATLSFSLQGAGATAYVVAPGSGASVAASGGSTTGEGVVFTPSAASAYAATLGIATSDPLCTPLPLPLALSGTGTQGQVALSTAALIFGTDPGDPSGLVNCGAVGPSQTLTVSNMGNQAFRVTALDLALGASSPYVLSGAGASLPALVPIGGSAAILVTPSSIPQSVPNPADASPFSDTLTLSTDAALDAPHAVRLVMQARGAVIADTPLSTTWTFAATPFGSIATIASTIRNTGNAGASIALVGLAQPTIFGLRNNPTTAVPGGVTSVIAQFVPPSSSGAWSDQAVLSVTPTGALCAPLPSQWTNPTIGLSGTSVTSH